MGKKTDRAPSRAGGGATGNDVEKERSARLERLERLLSERILVLDGAMGTAIQSLGLTAEDFGGPELEGCNEHLVLTRPDAILGIHRGHLEAGADIVETNTFGGTPLVLAEFGLEAKAYDINRRAAKLARRAASEMSTPDKPRFVAGSIGPTTKAISVTGGVTFEELTRHFYEQAKGLDAGGVDYYLVETCQDTRNIKAATLGIRRHLEESGHRIPIAVSGTIEPTGTMLAGQGVEALVASLLHLDLLYIGLNCATGPEFMTDHIRTLSAMAPFRVACVPNAGLPDENGNYLETPKMMARVLSQFVEAGWVNLLGGCCGTRNEHVAAFAELAKGRRPRAVPYGPGACLSGIEYLELSEDSRPYLVGERANVIGSRKFKELICEEKFEEAAEVGRAQVKGGAHVLDVCLANPDRNEAEDMRRFLDVLVRKVKAPLVIDSTDAKVIELALTYCQGKSLINSINLEDGEERFEKVVPLALKYGAALVVGTIDEDPNQGMGVTRDRKLAIARRSYDLLTKRFGVKPPDIYWDPLVFPVGTGDAQYKGSAVETIEGLRLLKREFPGTRTILGISNVSFGLPPGGREALNSVFLYHCVQAGLDLAIVNAEKLERYASLPEEDRRLCEDLLWNRGEDPVAAFAAHFRKKKAKAKPDRSSLPLDQRLANYIIEGSKDGLVADLELKLKEAKPLDIINGPLMAGMDEVGKLFNQNKLIVAEVLQSAEAMKAAVAYLEPFLEKSESSTRGKVILATVKGDVHDIGKNLVEIILANNGFQVVNLGIKVPPEKLIEAISEHKPDIVGLSGLLVKSAQQMVATANDFSRAGIQTPILVGGAALTSTFVDRQIAPAYTTGTVIYSGDAMQGLELAKTIVDPERFRQLKEELEHKRKPLGDTEAPVAATVKTRTERSPSVKILDELPEPEDFERHVLIGKTPIDQIWNYVNPMMLYGRHLGLRGGSAKRIPEALKNPREALKLEREDPKAFQVFRAVEEVKEAYRDTEHLRPAAVYRFFRAFSSGNEIHVWDERGNGLLTFEFPRMDKSPYLCLADYVHPDPAKGDSLGAFVVTVGRGVRNLAEALKARGDYLKSHIVQVLAMESAEAYAEYLHSQFRRMWGFPDAPQMTMLERFQAKYRGKRYSFGYAACPELGDQRKLFQLLNPSEIGVELTEGFMMDPEASVSAIVFHHPQGSYFSVGKGAA